MRGLFGRGLVVSIFQKAQAAVRRMPNWLADALIGLATALVVMTVAEAALPNKPAAPEPVRTAKLRPAEEPAAPAPAPAEQPVAEPVSASAIAFGRPIDGYPVISPFGVRQLPWEGAGRLHAGVDIAAPRGSPVFSVADGVVVAAGVDGGYGRYVMLRHAGGLYSRYAHLSTWSARLTPGAYVAAGEQIAQVGSTGSSTGAHLHFEIRDPSGRPLNPEFFMNREFASLDDLPVDQAARVTGPVRIAYVSGYPRGRREAPGRTSSAVRGPDGRGVVRKVLPSGAMVIHLGG
jgi:murein DD-endopeptidase MepM/ murein hydrolase activator NlpD